MSISDPTYIGQVASVTGSIVRVRLREDMPSTLVMISGKSYRVGQIGGFFRVPLGYANLYAVCTQIGADAMPHGGDEILGVALETENKFSLSGFRWMTIVLFGEGLGNDFERGVGQYPTVGDEVHLVTNDDLKVIYGWAKEKNGTVSVGQIAAASGISADISVAGLVSRHSAVVGSTGAGKSNLVTVLLETVSDGSLPNARTVNMQRHSATRPKSFASSRRINLGHAHCVCPSGRYLFLSFRNLHSVGYSPITKRPSETKCLT